MLISQNLKSHNPKPTSAFGQQQSTQQMLSAQSKWLGPRILLKYRKQSLCQREVIVLIVTVSKEFANMDFTD